MPKIKCLQCDKIEQKEYAQKFCGRSCAATYNNKRRKHTDKTKEKISNSLLSRHPNKEKRIRISGQYHLQCKKCLKDFVADKYYRKYCSDKCTLEGRNRREINKISKRTAHKIMRRAFPNWKCPFCGWNETWEIHHIIPRKEGGSDDINNLVMLCPNHHSVSDLKQIDRDELRKYAIGKYHSEKELLKLYYFGKNKTFEVSW